MSHTVYILHSEKLDRYYIGYTGDVSVRLEYHENARGSQFTAKADDWAIVFTLACNSKPQALEIEKHIKSMKSRTYILNLLKYPEMSDKLLNKYRVD